MRYMILFILESQFFIFRIFPFFSNILTIFDLQFHYFVLIWSKNSFFLKYLLSAECNLYFLKILKKVPQIPSLFFSSIVLYIFIVLQFWSFEFILQKENFLLLRSNFYNFFRIFMHFLISYRTMLLLFINLLLSYFLNQDLQNQIPLFSSVIFHSFLLFQTYSTPIMEYQK